MVSKEAKQLNEVIDELLLPVKRQLRDIPLEELNKVNKIFSVLQQRGQLEDPFDILSRRLILYLIKELPDDPELKAYDMEKYFPSAFFKLMERQSFKSTYSPIGETIELVDKHWFKLSEDTKWRLAILVDCFEELLFDQSEGQYIEMILIATGKRLNEHSDEILQIFDLIYQDILRSQLTAAYLTPDLVKIVSNYLI